MLQWWDYLSSVSILLPVLAALYGYKRQDKEMKLLSGLLILGALSEIADVILSRNKLNNIWLFNLYSIVEGFILCYVIGKWYQSRELFRLAIYLFICYSCFWIYNVLFSHGLFEFNSAEKTVKGIILISLSGYLLLRLSRNENIVISTDYRFWILSAIIFYFSVTLIVFSTATYFLEDQHRAMYYSWTIHSIVNIIANCFFASGFIWYYRKMNSFI